MEWLTLGGVSAEALGCAFESRILYRKNILQSKDEQMSSTKREIRYPPPNNSILPELTLTHGAFSCSGTVLFANGTGIVKTDSTKPMIYCLRSEWRRMRRRKSDSSSKIHLSQNQHEDSRKYLSGRRWDMEVGQGGLLAPPWVSLWEMVIQERA